MGSTRLYGKVLKKVCDKPLLLLLLERLKKSKTLDEIIIATTRKKRDDAIVELAEKYGFKYFRGSESDCLDRHYKAAKKLRLKYIAKTTSDCCLIDPAVVDKIVNFFFKNYPKYDYVSNINPPTYPNGQDIEIFTFEALEKTWLEARTLEDREHTTTYMRAHPEKFLSYNIFLPQNRNLFKTQRWCLDYREDYEFIKKIYEALYVKKRIFNMNDIQNLLKIRQDILDINKHLIKFNTVHQPNIISRKKLRK